MPHPFRAKTPPNIFQTVLVGGRQADVIIRAVQRFEKRGNKRNRNYAVVNPFFRRGGRWGHTKDEADYCRAIKNTLREYGIHVFPTTAQLALKKMILKGQKTRHLYIEMPPGQYYAGGKKHRTEGWGAAKEIIDQVFMHAPKVLLPGGQIFISTEGEHLLHYFIKIAKENSFSTGRLREFPPLNITQLDKKELEKLMHSGRISTYEQSLRHEPLYRIAAIFHPKTLYKAERKRLGKNRDSGK